MGRARVALEAITLPNTPPTFGANMLSFSDDIYTFSVDFHAFDNITERWTFRTTITVEGVQVYTATELRSGTTSADNPPRLADMLATFLNFLSAWVEALDHEARTGTESENGNLFPPSLAPYMSQIGADQLTIWAYEILGE